MDEPRLAFAVVHHDQPAIEVRVNFGVFAGRHVTPAEIDDLAHFLLDEVGAVTIVAEERHELDRSLETSVHLVRIELAASQVPDNDLDRRRLEHKVVERAEHWARSCIAHRRVPGIELE
ncbi:MAG TPA: hypothetical protein VGL76_02035 [Gaiellaceae bacterium]|jgi:hypothetical protein